MVNHESLFERTLEYLTDHYFDRHILRESFPHFDDLVKNPRKKYSTSELTIELMDELKNSFPLVLDEADSALISDLVLKYVSLFKLKDTGLERNDIQVLEVAQMSGHSNPLRIRYKVANSVVPKTVFVKNYDQRRLYGMELSNLLDGWTCDFLAIPGKLIIQDEVPGELMSYEKPFEESPGLFSALARFNYRIRLMLVGDMNLHNFVVQRLNDTYNLKGIDFDSLFEGTGIQDFLVLNEYDPKFSRGVKADFGILDFTSYDLEKNQELKEKLILLEKEEAHKIQNSLQTKQNRIYQLLSLIRKDSKFEIDLLEHEPLLDYFLRETNDSRYLKAKHFSNVLELNLFHTDKLATGYFNRKGFY